MPGRGTCEQRLSTGVPGGLFGGEGQRRALALWSDRPGAGGLITFAKSEDSRSNWFPWRTEGNNVEIARPAGLAY